MTAPLERVLRAFLDDPAVPRYGYDLMKAAGLKSGTLYPMLGRLEDDRLVTSTWETPQQDGQRPRKYYRLTGEGIRVARLELAQVSAGRPRAALAARSRGAWDEGGTPAAAHRRVPDRPRIPAPAWGDTRRAPPGMGGRTARDSLRSRYQAGRAPRRPDAGVCGRRRLGYRPGCRRCTRPADGGHSRGGRSVHGRFSGRCGLEHQECGECTRGLGSLLLDRARRRLPGYVRLGTGPADK